MERKQDIMWKQVSENEYQLWADLNTESVKEVASLPCVTHIETYSNLPYYVHFDPRYDVAGAMAAVEVVVNKC